MQSELKPCPFCGSKDLVTEQMEGTIRYPAYRIRCDHCGASSRYSDRDDWWAAWNTRASDAEITRLNEALRARVDAACSALRVAAAHVDALAERILDTAPWYIRRAVESEAKTLEGAAVMIRAIDPNQFAGEMP